MMEVYLNGVLVDVDRELVLLGDFLGLQHVKRVPGMQVFVNDEPVGHAQWAKYPILDGDRVDYKYPEGVDVEVLAKQKKDKYAHMQKRKEK